jgi:hypothetical protein
MALTDLGSHKSPIMTSSLRSLVSIRRPSSPSWPLTVTAVTESDAEEEELTTAVAAKRVGVSRMTLVRYAEQGYVSPSRVLPSGHRRWKLSELQRQLRELPPRSERKPQG